MIYDMIWYDIWYDVIWYDMIWYNNKWHLVGFYSFDIWGFIENMSF